MSLRQTSTPNFRVWSFRSASSRSAGSSGDGRRGRKATVGPPDGVLTGGVLQRRAQPGILSELPDDVAAARPR